MSVLTMENIVLIGMPGAGKSTVGVLLAKEMSRSFIDVDVIIQAAEGRRLQEIIDTDGLEAFRELEEEYLLSVKLLGYIIATGGSAVYSHAGMTQLGRNGRIVYLQLPLEQLERRLTNLDSRGVAMAPHQTLRSLYEERRPLYERYADQTVNCSGKTQEQIVQEIVDSIG